MVGSLLRELLSNLTHHADTAVQLYPLIQNRVSHSDEDGSCRKGPWFGDFDFLKLFFVVNKISHCLSSLMREFSDILNVS